MKKVIELLKAYLLDLVRRPANLVFGALMVFGVLILTGFLLNQGTTSEIIASYSAFIASYAAVSAVAYSITGEKEKGLYRMYRSSKLSKKDYVIEKLVMSSLPLGFSFAVILIGYFTTPIELSPLIVPVLLLCVLSHSGIGLVFGAYFNTNEEMQKVVTIFLISMIFLAPVFYTAKDLPNAIQAVQRLVPLTYGAEAMRAILIEGGTLNQIKEQLAVLSGLTVISLGIGYRKLEF